ncbi:MAG: PDDEXK nuclease domain-containing protein [Elusimicrobiota bacterium]
MNKLIPLESFNTLYKKIKTILDEARNKIYRAVNFTIVEAYWNIGHLIVEEEQKGKRRAVYGKELIEKLSKKLTNDFGKGFDATNVWNMRKFYMMFPILDALRQELTWTHYRLLMRVNDTNARAFYIKEAIAGNWSTRQLDRQIDSLLFERISLSKDKKGVLKLAQKGHIIEKPEDAVKDPYILEFLGIPEKHQFNETQIEQALIEHLQEFILELGKGFTFVARQKRITVENEHFYIDLVFYNYILKCFVIIDLKVGKLKHQDIGQMDFYVRYFEKEVKQQDDNPTIGLILCSDKNRTMVKYTLLSESKRIFASKYKLYLPTEKELKAEIEREKSILQIESKLKY